MPVYVEQLTKSLTRHDEKTAKIMIKSLANNLRALGRCNDTNREFLTQDHINALGPLIKQTLDIVTGLKSAHKTFLQQSKANYDIDEEDVDKIKDEMAQIGRVASQVKELTGQLVEKFNDAALPVIESSSKAYWAGLL